MISWIGRRLSSDDVGVEALKLDFNGRLQWLSRGAPKPASAGRSKPASALTHIPHLFDPMQLSIELSAACQDA
jgi:hypothetical protein